MQLNPYQDLPWEQLMPTARRKLLCSDKDYMFVLMECKAGTAQPPHSHPHTQVDYLLEGEIDMQVGDEVRRMHAGDIVQAYPAMCPTPLPGLPGYPLAGILHPCPRGHFAPGRTERKRIIQTLWRPLLQGARFLFCLFQ